MTDLFKFWSEIKRGENIHPADRQVLKRISKKQHGFDLTCLPSHFTGCLETAPVVLLFLSPGLSKKDKKFALTKTGKDHYQRLWRGNEPVSSDFPGYEWFKKITKCFAEIEKAKEKIAILNIGAYHSERVTCYASLTALPSSKVSLSWAQEVLFSQAEKGERIVICMRSAKYWGLETGKKYGRSLFAPHVTISGHLRKIPENEKIISLVRAKLNEP